VAAPLEAHRLRPASAARPFAPAAVGLGIAALYLPVVVHAAGVWSLDQELSFGFLVPPAAAAVVGLRWRQLQAAVAPGSGLGLPLLAGGLLLYAAGLRSGVHAAAGASFPLTVVGAAAYLYGVPAARLLAPPAALSGVALSLYRGLLAPLGFALQDLTARGSATLAALGGVPVRRSGVDLFVGDAHFVVAESCSGMDSLLALLSLGFLVAILATARWPRRLLLLALVVPVVLAANVFRVAVVLALSERFGAAAGEGLPHEALSAGVFLAASLALWLACVILRCQPRFDATPSSSF
jgi:exosortase